MPPPSSGRPSGIPVKPQAMAAMPPPVAPTAPGAPAKPSEAGKPSSTAAASHGVPGQSALAQKEPPLAPPPASRATDASTAAAPLKPDTQKPLLPAAGEPKAQTQTGVRATPDRSAAPRSEPAPAPARALAGLPPIDADTSAAAASALGALAAGLAASSSKPSGGVLPEPPPLPPLSLPPLAARLEAATPLPPALPASAAGHQPRATTSLEGLVAELLQPMLRQWLAEHLPRIVEEAVRTEVAANLRSGRPPRS
jgi:hypothetical protein